MAPYLSDRRLADVIAAIQAMGTYKYYKLDFAGWADRITGDSKQADHWKKVFLEHPEFFRLDSNRRRASLILRRQKQRLFNVDEERNYTISEHGALTLEERSRFSRSPITANEVGSLISVAISLHSKAVEQQRDKRWWYVPAFALTGSLIGGLVTKFL